MGGCPSVRFKEPEPKVVRITSLRVCLNRGSHFGESRKVKAFRFLRIHFRSGSLRRISVLQGKTIFLFFLRVPLDVAKPAETKRPSNLNYCER